MFDDNTADQEELSRFVTARAGLPAEQQLAITDIARKHKMHDDDPLWVVIEALQLHSNYMSALPPSLVNAGDLAAEKFDTKIHQISELAEGLADQTEKARAGIKTAAEDGARGAVAVAIKALQTEKIIEEVARQIAEQHAAKNKHDWSKIGLVVCSIAVILAFAGGVAIAWLVKPAPDPQAPVLSSQLSAIAECSPNPNRQFFCKLKEQKKWN